MQEGIYHDNFAGHTCPGCKALRARLAEVEAQREGLADLLRIAANNAHDSGEEDSFEDAINVELAKLEEK